MKFYKNRGVQRRFPLKNGRKFGKILHRKKIWKRPLIELDHVFWAGSPSLSLFLPSPSPISLCKVRPEVQRARMSRLRPSSNHLFLSLHSTVSLSHSSTISLSWIAFPFFLLAISTVSCDRVGPVFQPSHTPARRVQEVSKRLGLAWQQPNHDGGGAWTRVAMAKLLIVMVLSVHNESSRIVGTLSCAKWQNFASRSEPNGALFRSNDLP